MELFTDQKTQQTEMASRCSVAVMLEQHGLAECIDSLVTQGGLTDLDDLKGVTDQELQDLGVSKLFHRKKILRLAESGGVLTASLSAGLGNSSLGQPPSNMTPTSQQQPLAPKPGSSSAQSGVPTQANPSAASPTSPPTFNRIEGGDHIRVEVLGARGCSIVMTERDYYVKASLCDIVDHAFYPVEGSSTRTEYARGPQPVWSSSQPLKINTTFRSHCVAFELKERRLIGDNKLLGIAVFPTSFFHKFSDKTVHDTWFPFRADCERDSEVTIDVRLKLSVPGGCPKNNAAAFHVKGVVMNERKLRITVFNATIHNKDGVYNSELPDTYVTVHLEGLDSRPNNTTTDKAVQNSSLQTKSKTGVCQKSLTPAFDEAFEYFAEASRTKLVTIKLKRESGVVFTSHELIGQVRIPIQFYLAQKNPSEVDEVFAARDENGVEQAHMHIRLEVLARDVFENAPQFKRVESLKKKLGKAPLESVEDHPALSPKGKRGVRQGFSASDDDEAPVRGTRAVASDSEAEDESSMLAAAAARFNQRRASSSSDDR